MAELASVDDLICILHKCRKRRDIVHAKHLHAHICSNGLEAHRALGNYIVPMFIECGSVPDAQHVFNMLVHRNAHSWTSLISGYIQCGELQQALNLYNKMQEDRVPTNSYMLLTILKACARLKDVERGHQVHGEIVQKGFETDLFVGSALVDMHSKCGSLPEAEEAFNKLQVQNVVSWNALIAGYAEQGHGREVLKYFEQMQLEGISPDIVTLACVLKACSNLRAVDKGQELHTQITHKGFEREIYVGSALVSMYGKSGLIADARDIFDKLSVPDVVSWTALIAGYADHGTGQEALACLTQMGSEGISPNAVTFACSLKACGSIEAIDKGREMHMAIAENGFEKDIFVGSSLVDMYAKCGSMIEAQEVFNKLPVQNVVSWNALLAGYAEHGPGQDGLKCFEQMQLEVSPDVVTFACALKACSSRGAVDKGRKMHSEITRRQFERDTLAGSGLVDMYAKCGLLSEAQEVFDELPVRTTVAWNALITAYVKHGLSQEVFNSFENMQLEGVSPNDAALICVLKGCGNIEAVDKGREIHMEVTWQGIEKDLFVGNTLLDMYTKCGLLSEAQEVFDKLPRRDVVSWTALTAGYVEHGLVQEASKCFEQMQLKGIPFDGAIFACILKACGSISAIDQGREIHMKAIQEGFERDLVVGCTLVDMYAKCCLLSEAQEVFDKLAVQNIVSWNALIAGYSEHGPEQEALKCLEQLQLEGISANAVTFLCILKACGKMTAIDKCREMHTEIIQSGFDAGIQAGSALVDMYAKCGSLSEAWEVFNKLPAQNVVSWNSIIRGYGTNHEGNIAVKVLESMQEHSVIPDAITFTCLLTACSRASLVLEGQELFKVMVEEYGIVPTLDHFACMVDLFARSGNLLEAEKFLERVPYFPSEDMWTALLSACQTYEEAELGMRCFQQLVCMNPDCAAPYVLMENIYASSGQWDRVFRMEEMRTRWQAKKKPASALIEVNKRVHEFVVGNSQSKEISDMLEMLNLRMEQEGHVPNIDQVFTPIFNIEKNRALHEHARNMSMYNNWHNTSKIVSRIDRRNTIVGDICSVHNSKDGLCFRRYVR